MSTALIVIDIQNDYFQNGKMELVTPDKAADNAAQVLEWFRKYNKENIYHVQHIAADPSLGFFLPDTEGAEISDTVTPLESESITIKNFPNSFLNTDLESKLKENGVDKVYVAGMMTHMCIDATVRAAVDMGYDTTLIEDACATKDLTYGDKTVDAQQVHYSFVGALDGMYAEITTTGEFLEQNK